MQPDAKCSHENRIFDNFTSARGLTCNHFLALWLRESTETFRNINTLCTVFDAGNSAQGVEIIALANIMFNRISVTNI